MNMVCPDEGKELILDELFRLVTARESFVLDLFQNNEVVDDDSTGADFTISTFTGYAQIAIARADFGVAVTVAHVGQITKTAAPTFTCTAGAAQDAYGWILRGAASGVIYFGQNFNVPRTISPGSIESIDPFRIKAKTFA